jgi:hypothetical protein
MLHLIEGNFLQKEGKLPRNEGDFLQNDPRDHQNEAMLELSEGK